MGSNKKIQLGNQFFRPEELSAFVLSQLKQDAEHYLNSPVTEAVISVPAYFNDTQRNATKLAAELAGLKVERLINEPTAAGLAFGLHEKDKNIKFLVLDLGGGTFDVSIIEIFDGIIEICSTAGDNFLGGEDFTQAIVEDFAEKYQIDLKKNNHQTKKLYAKLYKKSEQAKRELNLQDSVSIEIEWKNKPYQYHLNQNDFTKISESLLDRIKHPIERAFRDAHLDPTEIDRIVLVGGATRLHAIKKLATQLIGKLPLSHINPDEAIALGAAVQAALKERNAALNEFVLTDVCPFTLGVKGASSKDHNISIFLPVIERNTVIPVSRVERYETLIDNQSKLEVSIYQGESPNPDDNIFLDKISFLIPPKPAGEEKFDVRFSYDINGLLEVDITVLSTKETHDLVIKNTENAMSDEEITTSLKKLSKLKIHPREKAENRALTARAERLYEELTGDNRTLVREWLTEFLVILEKQDPILIAKAREPFKTRLDKLEESLTLL